jgi:hypothetical protein
MFCQWMRSPLYSSALKLDYVSTLLSGHAKTAR